MYKLVVVAGKLRGKEYALVEGENILGRDAGCDIHFSVQGVSKKHLSITVTGDACYLQDLNSSNGTFLNGKLIKRATAKNSDKIALPDSIIQIVYVEEKKIIIKKRMSSDDDDDEEEYLTGGVPPQALPAKLVWLFKYKLMKLIHGFNEEFEWKVLFGIILTGFCIVTVLVTILPVLQTNRQILLDEIGQRGGHYAEEIGRINSKVLARRELDKVDTNFLATEDGVKEYRLFDLDGRIVRPMEKLNDHLEDPFSISTMEWFLSNKRRIETDVTLKKILKGGIVGIGKMVKAFNAKTGQVEPVGIITIKFAPRSLEKEAILSSKAYLEALASNGLVAILFFGIVYFLTIRHFDEIKFQIEECLRGKRKGLESNYLFAELNPLRSSINTILQRMRELSSEADDEFAEEEDDAAYVETLHQFMRGSGVPVMVLDSQKNLSYINHIAEDLTGVRETSSQGMSLLDVCRERGFAGTLLELCESSASNQGSSQEEVYELGGDEHTLYVTALIGKDNFAKAFYVTMIKDT